MLQIIIQTNLRVSPYCTRCVCCCTIGIRWMHIFFTFANMIELSLRIIRRVFLCNCPLALFAHLMCYKSNHAAVVLMVCFPDFKGILFKSIEPQINLTSFVFFLAFINHLRTLNFTFEFLQKCLMHFTQHCHVFFFSLYL